MTLPIMGTFVPRAVWTFSVGLALSVCTGAFATAPLRAAEEWKPAKGPLATRWTETVTPKNAHREYPRPQMVRDNWTNLNGLWQYAITAVGADQPVEFDGNILVPFPIESALSGVMKPVGADKQLWYRRTFATPQRREDTRLLLNFGAVDWQAQVLINGQLVGTHQGGYDPFTFDITDALRDADDQEIVVVVWDPTDQGDQPRGKQVLKPEGIWYTAVTGIWQTVWLEVVPERYVSGLTIVPDVDSGTVAITAKLGGAARVEPDREMRVEVLDGSRAVADVTGPAISTIKVPVPDAKLWSPDEPFLYDLRITLAGRDPDTVHSYFGMRKIALGKDEAGANRLLLNGEPLFQYGPLDQGWWPDGLYTAPNDEALRYDVEMTKKLGFNMARKHVKVEPARWYYWCDKLGLLVWQDMPSGNNASFQGQRNFERELAAMIDARSNHPSIIMWVPFNEGWGQHDTGRIVEFVRQRDPSRLVNNASGWTDASTGDVHDIHSYPGPSAPAIEEKRAAVLGEFGGLGLPVKGHTWQDEKNWGYRSFTTPEALTDAYVELLTRLRPLIGQGLAAAVYTQTTDVEIEVNGLMTYDREVSKMDPDTIASAAAKLYLPPPSVEVVVATSEHEPQSWRYTLEQPADGWEKADFDDAKWDSGPGGFGRANTPGTVVRTEWHTDDIWVRRTFELDEPPAEAHLLIHHDEDAEVYINGVRVAELKGYTTAYIVYPLSAEAQKAFRAGRNVLAIHCHQTGGGQYIDAGIVNLVEAK